MRTVKNLINSKNSKSLGSHYVHINTVESIRDFYYYNSIICKVNDLSKVFKLDDNKYNTEKTVSIINSFRENLLSLGYKEI